MKAMFQECSSLTNLDLSSFNTSNVTNISNMFNNNSNLTNIDLSSFDFSRVTTSSDMFYNVPTNSLIYVKNDVSKKFILGVRNDLTNVQVKSA